VLTRSSAAITAVGTRCSNLLALPAGPAPGVFGPRRSARRLAHTACTLHTAGSRTRHPNGHHQL